VLTANGPVVVISVASPRVGNNCFRTAVQTLERLQLLQHLRISNEDDLVTLLPVVALKETALPSSILAPTKGSVDLYKHCGIQIDLKAGDLEGCWYERELFNVTYARDKTDDEGILPEELRRSMTAAKSLLGSLVTSRADPTRITNSHSCDEYERRLGYCKGYLSNISLDQLYADTKLVGSAVAFPVPIEEKHAKKFAFIGKKNTSGTLMV
jgi:Lipase (class 3)